MLHLTLTKPGYDVADKEHGAINLDYAGGGIVLYVVGASSPKPYYMDNAREAQEFILRTAVQLLDAGYQLETGE